MSRPTEMALAAAIAVLLYIPTELPAQTPAGPATMAEQEATPGAAPPSLADARWIGFTPVLVVAAGSDANAGEGAWIAGPFVEGGATGWVSDTASGLTAEVRLIWRDIAPGSVAALSVEAGRALGLVPGAVTNVAVYRAR